MRDKTVYAKKWILFLILLLLFIVLTWTILKTEPFWLDQKISLFIESIRNPQMTVLFKWITNLVSVPALVVVCLLIYGNKSTRKDGNIIVLNLAVVATLNSLLKLVFARDRPTGISLIQETGYSFPSGHSMISMAYFGLFIYLIYHSHFSAKKRWSMILLLSFLIFLIGISRIYLGVHYPSDVIGGFFLSVAYLILFTHIVFIYRRKRKCKNDIQKEI